jgi:hypothetical protein
LQHHLRQLPSQTGRTPPSTPSSFTSAPRLPKSTQTVSFRPPSLDVARRLSLYLFLCTLSIRRLPGRFFECAAGSCAR